MEKIEDMAFFAEGTLLLADASGDDISMCISKDGAVICETQALGGALENIFSSFCRILSDANLKAESINAFGFCRGPGSILGIRILSAAFATLRSANPQAKLFVWDLLDVYSEFVHPSIGENFSIVCPSRKLYANALSRDGGVISKAEIPSAKIADLTKPTMLINQRKIADANFEGLAQIYFPCSKIFDLFKLKPEFAHMLESGEIADALTLAKREYAKWNFQAHS